MIFRTLVIKDFGVYRGENHFELSPLHDNDDKRSIILFGGKNGSGKTTILEAIRLCLYGRLALSSRARKRDYDTYIGQRIHRYLSNQPLQQAEIRLVFEHIHAGNHSIYEAVRAWRYEAKKLVETIHIFKDSNYFHDILPEHWDDFLRDLIPPGVADLFFFDGEQIQSLANEDTESEALADAIRGLLNLEIVERLQSDLSTYLRKQKKREHKQIRRAAEQLNKKLELIRENILELRERRAEIRTKLDHVNKRIESARQMLLREGGGFIEQRDQLIQQRDWLDSEIDRVSEQIREITAELIPFALIPKWNNRLRERLQLESVAQKEKLTQDVLNDKTRQLVDVLSSADFKQKYARDVSDNDWDKLLTEVATTLKHSSTYQDIQLRHSITDETYQRIQGWMQQAMTEVPQTLHELSVYLEKLETERSGLEKTLKQIPDEDIVKPLIDNFQKLAYQEGSMNEQLVEIDETIRKHKLSEAETERSSLKIWKELGQAVGLEGRIKRAVQAQSILDQYLERITAIKINELQEQFIQYLTLLARKKKFIAKVIIDPVTFDSTLFDENNVVIPKTELSAGEKQLYAMALLWALRAVSGRVLPIIMDTPMGRLDTDHRSALIQNFFPNIAHQVIILSTDSEIDLSGFSRLKNKVSRAYRLEYNDQKGYTEVFDGYFEDLYSDKAI